MTTSTVPFVPRTHAPRSAYRTHACSNSNNNTCTTVVHAAPAAATAHAQRHAMLSGGAAGYAASAHCVDACDTAHRAAPHYHGNNYNMHPRMTASRPLKQLLHHEIALVMLLFSMQSFFERSFGVGGPLSTEMIAGTRFSEYSKPSSSWWWGRQHDGEDYFASYAHDGEPMRRTGLLDGACARTLHSAQQQQQQQQQRQRQQGRRASRGNKADEDDDELPPPTPHDTDKTHDDNNNDTHDMNEATAAAASEQRRRRSFATHDDVWDNVFSFLPWREVLRMRGVSTVHFRCSLAYVAILRMPHTHTPACFLPVHDDFDADEAAVEAALRPRHAGWPSLVCGTPTSAMPPCEARASSCGDCCAGGSSEGNGYYVGGNVVDGYSGGCDGADAVSSGSRCGHSPQHHQPYYHYYNSSNNGDVATTEAWWGAQAEQATCIRGGGGGLYCSESNMGSCCTLDDAAASTTATVMTAAAPYDGAVVASPTTSAPLPPTTTMAAAAAVPPVMQRMFFGQLRRDGTVPMVRWLVHYVFDAPAWALHSVENHRHKRTALGKGCAWPTITDPATIARLLDAHHRLFYDLLDGGVEGVWLVPHAHTHALAEEVAQRYVARAHARHMPRATFVAELSASAPALYAGPAVVAEASRTTTAAATTMADPAATAGAALPTTWQPPCVVAPTVHYPAMPSYRQPHVTQGPTRPATTATAATARPQPPMPWRSSSRSHAGVMTYEEAMTTAAPYACSVPHEHEYSYTDGGVASPVSSCHYATMDATTPSAAAALSLPCYGHASNMAADDVVATTATAAGGCVAAAGAYDAVLCEASGIVEQDGEGACEGCGVATAETASVASSNGGNSVAAASTTTTTMKVVNSGGGRCAVGAAAHSVAPSPTTMLPSYECAVTMGAQQSSSTYASHHVDYPCGAVIVEPNGMWRNNPYQPIVLL